MTRHNARHERTWHCLSIRLFCGDVVQVNIRSSTGIMKRIVMIDVWPVHHKVVGDRWQVFTTRRAQSQLLQMTAQSKSKRIGSAATYRQHGPSEHPSQTHGAQVEEPWDHKQHGSTRETRREVSDALRSDKEERTGGMRDHAGLSETQSHGSGVQTISSNGRTTLPLPDHACWQDRKPETKRKHAKTHS